MTPEQAKERGIKVKPLVWCDLHGDGSLYCPRKTINPFDFPAPITNRGMLGWHYAGVTYKTIEEAQSSAQADYERRILEALE